MENQEADLSPMRLSIASTFTCNPIEDAFEFWSEKFGFKTVVHFSLYDQVFQELLNKHSSLNHPDNDARMVFIKFDDWTRNLSNLAESSTDFHVVANIHSLCEYAAISASYAKSPLFLTITRNSRDSFITPDQQSVYEQLIKDNLSEHSNIFITTSSEINRKYPVDDYYDAQRDQLGHIPYKREYFTALATSVFRKVLAGKRKPYKVVVLDCDNTLWGDVCGEVGPQGISLSKPYKTLQNFMLQQVKSGKILCLCSKNVQEDVDSVFSERPDMVIRKEDIVGSKINWEAKSQNIKKLSEELSLGLDSFIFIDDNPIECAEVRANCPEVLTLNLPKKPEEITSFLEHVWPFDSLKKTDEDQQRTKLYKDNIKRSGYKNESSSLKEFIEGLNLDIRIKNARPKEISRVSQLTYRTNQFNFTTIRRSQEEIKELLKTGGFTCKICRVKDRFGDYGLVGAVLYQTLSDRIVLDSFMLSCRILGRGVEHKMLKSVGEEAIAKGIDSVQINFQKSEKNQPALNFLTSVFEDFSENFSPKIKGYMTSSAYVSKLSYNPDKSTSFNEIANGRAKDPTPKIPVKHNGLIFEQIAQSLNNTLKITHLLSSNGHSPTTLPTESSSPIKKDTVQIITEIWENVLDKTGIRPDQHFFDVGGTSLKAVEVLSQLNERFNKNLTIVSLFEHSTIQSLVNLIEETPAEDTDFSKIIKRAASRRDRFRQRE
ncbi:MAG: HAD-IIIC family phosphatase [Balneolaceae bacterium]